MPDNVPTHEQIALIGAGPSGLAGARNLQKHGVPFQGFEAHSDVGGLWDIDNPRSTVYHSAHLISSKRTTEFAEFPMADTVADYPSHRELRRYFSDFADHFALRPHFRFNTRVLRVEPVSDAPDTRWRVSVDAGGGKVETAEYKGVVIANGTLAEPKRPQFEGHFDGELLHTSGKRPLPPWLKQKVDSTVLKWFTGDPVRFGFPKPDYKMYESHPIVNSLVLHHVGHGDIGVRADIARLDGHTVHFKDGSARDYDLILAATGYALHYPFIDRELLNWQGMAPRLYLNIFSPRFESLAVLGMIEASGIGWQGRYEQAELLARYFRAKAAGSPKAAALRAAVQGPSPDLSGGFKYLQLERMAYYVHKDTYRAAVRSAAAALADPS
jgi:hypothetical protein